MATLRPLIALLIMLWLPLQAVAAVAMPFCRHAMADPGATANLSADVNALHAAHSAGQHPQHGGAHAPADGDHGLSCNDCGACHLACAPMLAPTPVALPPDEIPTRLMIAEPDKPRGFLSEQRTPPPLARA
jgi:hypothetical protein